MTAIPAAIPTPIPTAISIDNRNKNSKSKCDDHADARPASPDRWSPTKTNSATRSSTRYGCACGSSTTPERIAEARGIARHCACTMAGRRSSPSQCRAATWLCQPKPIRSKGKPLTASCAASGSASRGPSTIDARPAPGSQLGDAIAATAQDAAGLAPHRARPRTDRRQTRAAGSPRYRNFAAPAGAARSCPARG